MKRLGVFDRAFILQRTWADPRLMDGALDPSDRPVGVCYAGDPKVANFSPARHRADEYAAHLAVDVEPA